MVRLVVLVALALVGLPSLAHAQDVDAPGVRQAIEAAIDMDAGRDIARLPRVTLDNGDLTVIFAMQRPGDDDPAHVEQVAQTDVLAILQAIYASEDAPTIRSATVLGTYRVVGKYERGKEIALLRAVLSPERAASFDWLSTTVGDLDVFWTPGDLAKLNAVGSPAR
jgi:hypothetical protein